MHKLKSHQTVENIARKHRQDISFVKNQLRMGIAIEKEHTKDKDLATDIALQHLDEFPDYYTKLKKMESDAKKEHKKFKDVKEDAVTDLQKGIVELDDASYASIDNLMRRIMRKRKVTAKQLHNDFVDKHNQTPDTWAKKKGKNIKDVKEGTLHKWFKRSESKDEEPGWVNVLTGGTCASDEPGEGVPKCVSSEKRASMTKAQRLSAARRKKAADPAQQEKSGAARPTYVSTDKPENKMNEEKDIKGKGSGKKDACYNKVKSRYDVWPSAYASGALVKCRKVGATNWGNKSESLNYDWDTPVRERPDRYCPKCEKLERRNECKYGTKYWDMFSLPAEIISSKKDYNTIMPHPGNMPEEKDHEYSMARSEISTIISAAKRLKNKLKGEGNIEAWVQSKITKAADYIDTAADYLESGEHDVVDEACWVGYKQVGMKKKGKKMVPNCVKESVSIEDLNGNHYVQFIDIIKPEPLKATKGIGSRLVGESISSESKTKVFTKFMVEASAAWQRKEGKNPEGGLNKKGIASYRRENPGSKLSMAVTTPPSKLKPGSKSAKRRKSFCARMSGMPGPMKDEKGRPTRKALSLRKWNC